MFPDQSIDASIDLRGEYLIPIHWGAFTLSTHAWTEPPEEVFKLAPLRGQKIILPEIGQVITLGKPVYGNQKWWNNFYIILKKNTKKENILKTFTLLRLM